MTEPQDNKTEYDLRQERERRDREANEEWREYNNDMARRGEFGYHHVLAPYELAPGDDS